MVSINKRAVKIVKQVIEDPEYLGCKVIKMDCGATLVDMGVQCKGSWEAGLLFSRITLGDLAKVQLSDFYLNDDYSFSAVEVFVDEPLISCLASQIAGWKLGEGEFATIGSGPARAVAAVDSDFYLEMTPYRDKNNEVVLCIQDTKYPDDSIALKIAEACGVKPEDTYLVIAPSACIVGSIQVSARILEQVCHKMYEKGFDVSQVVSCRGKAPIAPIAKDEVKSMGRINDAILYGGEVEFWVDSTDEEIAKTIHQLVSKTSSPYYPELFGEIFDKAGRDFYYIDHDFHSIAKIQIHNINTGKAFSAGEISYDVLEKSFLR